MHVKLPQMVGIYTKFIIVASGVWGEEIEQWLGT